MDVHLEHMFKLFFLYIYTCHCFDLILLYCKEKEGIQGEMLVCILHF